MDKRRSVAARDYVMRRLSTVDVEVVAKALLAGVEKTTTARWEAAVARAEALPGDVRPEKIKSLSDSFARELGAVGAAAGMAAATPLVGTGATLMAATAELAWFTARSGDLILTIAALHGRPTPSVDERRAWVLAVLIFGSTARQGFSKIANQMGANIEENSKAGLSLATLRAVNGALSRMLVKRYGTRRGAIALGTALPLGVGALVGGGSNYVAIRKLVKQADSFFAHLPYSSIETTGIELAGSV
ncbi:MAG: hypothetical protein JWN62_1652 [Acidimicrobiales bacterium]|nr:hypothetical protein [Acidimicrobiales bacterium]